MAVSRPNDCFCAARCRLSSHSAYG